MMFGKKIKKGFIDISFVEEIDKIELYCRNICSKFVSVVLTIERFPKLSDIWIIFYSVDLIFQMNFN